MVEDYDRESEEQNLQASWDELDEDYLDTYLVSGVEDPRINPQSILTRALLIDTLWPDEYSELIDAELRFGAVLTWICRRIQADIRPPELLSQMPVEGACPEPIRRTFLRLRSADCPVPDYISLALSELDQGGSLAGAALEVFTGIWRARLEECEAEPISVLEPGCGSANDYRAIRSCGLPPFLRYAGYDIAPANIRNARERFPEVDFSVDSIMDSDVRDDGFDYSFVHDVFEHLSLEALEDALSEVLRTTREEAWLHFFNAEDREEHLVQPTERYYRNLLSVPRLVESLEEQGAAVEVIYIPDLLESKFGLGECFHNQEAVTLLARPGAGS